jgi:hypothetical protein
MRIHTATVEVGPAYRPRAAAVQGHAEKETIMQTYDIDAGWTEEHAALYGEPWQVQFHAPIEGAEVLIRVICSERDALGVYERWQAPPPGDYQTWCQRCPNGTIPAPHQHDFWPEERGWLCTEMKNMRIMPLREAI